MKNFLFLPLLIFFCLAQPKPVHASAPHPDAAVSSVPNDPPVQPDPYRS